MPTESPKGFLSFRWRIGAGFLTVAAVAAAVWLFSRPEPVPAPETVREISRLEVERNNGRLTVRGESTPFTGRMTEKYPDGVRKLEISVVQGLISGISRGWYSNGQPEVEELFTDDVSHGKRKRWHRNGARKSEAEVVQGKLHGPYREWHENGARALEATMRDGEADGEAMAWYPSGEVKSRAVMKQGRTESRETFQSIAAQAGASVPPAAAN